MNQMTPQGLKPHRGTMVLVFGILGLLCCIIFGILAWVFGQSDLKEMAEGRMDPSGEGMTKAGKILGIVAVALQILGIVLWIFVFGGLAMAGMAAHH